MAMTKEKIEVMDHCDAEIRVYTVDFAFTDKEETELISVIPFFNFHHEKRQKFYADVQSVADKLEKAYTLWDQYINIEVRFKRTYCND